MRTIYLKNSKDYLERVTNFFYKYNQFLTYGIRYAETKIFSTLGVKVNEEFFDVIDQIYGISNIKIESKIINNDLYRRLFKVDKNNFKKTEIYKIVEYNKKHTKLCFTFHFNYKEDIIKLEKYINKNFKKRYTIDEKFYIYKNDDLCIIENVQEDFLEIKKYKIFLYNNITKFFNEIFLKFNYTYNIIDEQTYKNENYVRAVNTSICSQRQGNLLIWGDNPREKIFELVFLPNHETKDYFEFCLGNIKFCLNDYTEKKNYVKLEYHDIIENRIKDDMKTNLFESYIIQGNPGTGKTYFF